MRRRRIELNMGTGGSGHGMGGGMHAVNGGPFAMDRIDVRIRLGDVELWEASAEMMAHPLHIHGVQFEVLGRAGVSLGPRDQGPRDTVLVREPTELLVHFTQPALEEASFMLHCMCLSTKNTA